MGRTAKRAAKSSWVEGVGRAGLIAKGVLYLIVGLLAFFVAIGTRNRLEDREGALQWVAAQPLGRMLLFLLAVGLAAYAAWRFVQAFLDRDDDGEDIEGLAKRGSYFARGAWYTGLCAIAVSVLVGVDEKSGSNSEDRVTGFVLGLPFGRIFVGGVGLGILGYALYNAFRAVTARFRKSLETQKMSKRERGGATVVGVIGHAARFVVFALIGIFLVRAAWQYDPKETVGLAGALSEVLQEDGGRVWVGALGAGLVAYGLYCFTQARWRDV